MNRIVHVLEEVGACFCLEVVLIEISRHKQAMPCELVAWASGLRLVWRPMPCPAKWAPKGTTK